MSESNIVRGPKYRSSTFEEELEKTFLDDFLIAANERRTNEVYLIDASTNKKLRSKEFIDQSYNVAAELQAFGCDENTLVGILSENRLEYPIVVLSTLLTGAALICYNPAFTIEKLRREYEIVRPRVLFCSPKNYYNLKLIAHPSTKIIIFDSKAYRSSLSTTRAYHQKFGPRRTDDVAFVLYTSGTTGSPKGVVLSHKNMVYILKLLTEEKLVEVNGLKTLNIAPMFHAYGLINLLFTISEGRTLFIMPTFDNRLFLSTIQKYKIKQLRLVPTLILNLMKDPKVNEYDLSSLESVLCGDAPLKYQIEEAFKKKFGLKCVQQGYGMTECTLITTIKRVQSTKLASCGTVIPGAQLKIVDLTTGKTVVGKNQIGEICIKGPHVMKRYFGNPKATSEILDGEGWLHSGDVGYYDADEELFIKERKKELIYYKGFLVAPSDLEALLLTHPKITDCAVIGVTDRNEVVPIAFVVKLRDEEVTEQEIIQFVTGSVSPPTSLLVGVEFVFRIPRSQFWKIVHSQLHEFWNLRLRKVPIQNMRNLF